MPYDKDGKYYRQPTNSVNKSKKPSETRSIKRTPEQQAAYDKLSPEEKKALDKAVDKLNAEATPQKLVTYGVLLFLMLGGLIGGCVAFLNQEYEPKRNKYYTPEIQDFDVCVKKQKAKGLSTDKCWDALPKE